MSRDLVPDDVRRFVLTSIPSVPYLEALLLMRRESASSWTSEELARRIYAPEARAAQMLHELEAAGFAVRQPGDKASWCYQPESSLAEMTDKLARHYSTNLVGITDLIHSSLDRRAHQFSDAFRWRKD